MGLGLAIGSTPLSPMGLSGTLFGGYKAGRWIAGVGLQISTMTICPDSGGGGCNGGTIFSLLVVPGVRATLFRSADNKLELAGEGDIGGGGVFGATGPGADRLLGLPPGTSVPTTGRFVVDLGPEVLYWFHPQLALRAIALLRGDYTVYTMVGSPWSSRFDLNIVTGLGLLAVM
jgi:hypothetical protein